MRKFTETEIKEARAFLESRGVVPNWFRFTRELMSQITLLFELEKRDGVDAVKDPIIPGTLLFAFIDYFETGECPDYLNNLLSKATNPLTKRVLDNIIETGFQAIDETYMQYFSMTKGGEDGIQKRWNHLKNMESENKPKKKSGRVFKNEPHPGDEPFFSDDE